MTTVACRAVGLMSSPGVADVSVSWNSRRSSGMLSSRAWRCETRGHFKGKLLKLTILCHVHIELDCTWRMMAATDCLSFIVTVPEISSNSVESAGVIFQNTCTSPNTPGPRTRLVETDTHEGYHMDLTDPKHHLSSSDGFSPDSSTAVVIPPRFSHDNAPRRLRYPDKPQGGFVCHDSDGGQTWWSRDGRRTRRFRDKNMTDECITLQLMLLFFKPGPFRGSTTAAL